VLSFLEAKNGELRDLGNRRRDPGVVRIRSIFVPQDFLSVFLESLGRFARTNFAFLYPEPGSSDVPCPKGSRIIVVLRL